MSEDQKLAEDAQRSLDRIKNFTPEDLVQSERLGVANDFSAAVAPAKRLVHLFEQLPTSFLSELPDRELGVIRERSDSVYQMFSQILEFDPDLGDNRARRETLVESLRSAYQRIFTDLFPLISFSISRTVDFNSLEDQGRAAVRSIRDQAQSLITEMEKGRTEAAAALDAVQKIAAEGGVAQEAIYFKAEADEHKIASRNWRVATIWMAVAVGAYGIAVLLLHKITFLQTANLYEAVQLSIGKLLVFFVLAYMLSLCSRNFLSNRHNEIVNRHRQNALLTYRALSTASASPEARDIILNHAAAAIYGLHDTGYTKPGDATGSKSTSIVEVLPKTSISSGTSN